MEFARLAHTFEKLEKTSSRLALITILAELFRLIDSPDEIEQETSRRRRKHDIETMAQQMPLKAFVFDILYKNGAPLLEKPLVERMKILEETITPDDVLVLTSHQKDW